MSGISGNVLKLTKLTWNKQLPVATISSNYQWQLPVATASGNCQWQLPVATASGNYQWQLPVQPKQSENAYNSNTPTMFQITLNIYW